MSTDNKYRHPENAELEWSGRGRQPKWVEFFISNGGTLEQLEVGADADDSEGIDLGIGDVSPAKTVSPIEVALAIIDSEKSIPAAEEVKAEAVSGPVLPATEQGGRDLLNQLLGQAQAFSAASQLLQTFGVSKLAFVKENKLYRALKGMSAPNAFGVFLEGTWEEFCGLLGMSDEKANTDIANLRAFGEEALESMSRMGIGYRELRQFRKLPADQREALAQIATTGTKDDVLEAAYEAIEAERAKSSSLEVQAAELSEDLKLAERRGKNLDAEIERQEMKIKKLSSARQRCTAFLDRTEDIRAESLALQAEVELPLIALQKLFDEINAEDENLPEWRQQMEQVWLTAHVAFARALTMIEHMHDTVRTADPLPERISGTHIMTAAEAQRWILDYPMILNRHEAEADSRKEAREAARPKGPGRPKGSTNKAAGE